MTHINAVPWDAAILAELSDPAYAAMPDDAARADAMNAKMVAVPRTFTMREVRTIAQEASEWPNVVLRSEMRPPDAAVRAAINAVETPDDRKFAPTDTASANVFSAGIAALVAASDISPGTVAAIQALGVTTAPWWQSIGAPAPLNEWDIARAREGAV